MRSRFLALAFPFALLSFPHVTAQTHRAAAAHAAAQRSAAQEPAGPTAVFDTSGGRITCRLYEKEAPRTVANFIALAQGTRDWTDGSGAPQHGKPFYDATQMFGMSDGVAAGDRAAVGQGSAGAGSVPEKNAMTSDRAGRLLAMVIHGEQSPSTILVLDHADLEYAQRGTVFGQCDEPSIAVAGELSHTLLAADNRPTHPVVLRRVAIVPAGQPLPAPAPPIADEANLTIPPLPPPATPAPEPDGPTATIDTTMGTITCRLFSREAPIGVANFTGLATGTKPYKDPISHAEVRGKHFYDGLSFRRVIPDFMIQNADKPHDPDGGLDIGIRFANEVVPGLTFDRPGRLAYANAGPGTNSSEFFITEHAMHRLDGNYTIFGQCDDASVKVVEAIAHVPRDAHNKPLKPVVIRSVVISTAK